ncbi:hypothetical protein [Cohnella lupini]|uniref:Uncharacterized protein n=1 Tax=Cohnella lupini TaxID=1294267 RepID=A0A3D9IGW8_9BACL|nr:hypothetical protein [Cohnella lupini]RED60396.1 hypothetical protein DFP95_106186 [Cohnella lupini]
MDDKELFEQLERGPLNRKGFDETLRRKINESLDAPSRKHAKPWFVRWSALSAACLIIVAVAAGLWSWRDLTGEQSDKLSLETERATASSHASEEGYVNPIPHSAVVIGLRKDIDESDQSSYRTIFVAPENGQLTNMGDGEGIWMPYKTNFWKVNPSAESQAEGIQTLEALRDGKSKTVKEKDAANAGKWSEKLLFAGKEYVSILQTASAGEDDASEVPSKVWVNRVSDLAPLERLKDANIVQNNHFNLAAALGSSDVELSQDQWAIARENGKWVAKKPGNLLNVSADDIAGWQTIDEPLTVPVTGPDVLALDWEEVLKLEPTAIDAYTSEAEEVVAIVTPGSIKLYPYRMMPEEREVLTLPIDDGETVVMVQWAIEPKYVDGWKTLFGNWFGERAEKSGL